jgi:hypothetical protein
MATVAVGACNGTSVERRGRADIVDGESADRLLIRNHDGMSPPRSRHDLPAHVIVPAPRTPRPTGPQRVCGNPGVSQ